MIETITEYHLTCDECMSDTLIEPTLTAVIRAAVKEGWEIRNPLGRTQRHICDKCLKNAEEEEKE